VAADTATSGLNLQSPFQGLIGLACPPGCDPARPLQLVTLTGEQHFRSLLASNAPVIPILVKRAARPRPRVVQC